MSRSRWVAVSVIGVIGIVVVGRMLGVAGEDPYRLEILMPTADGIVEGDQVLLDGRSAGTIADVRVEDGQALVTVDVKDGFAPLQEGTAARISWEAVVQERFLELLPGAMSNRSIPSGGRIVSGRERVELDDVLAALDSKTLEDVNSLVQQLEQTLDGNERNVLKTLHTAGPAINALGEVLTAVGRDGPAIRRLVSQIHRVTDELARRDERIAATVTNLHQFAGAVAKKQGKLTAALGQLPPTLKQAEATLDKVPAAVDATVPLLETLRPATHQLPAVAKNLDAVLVDLGPALEQLGPTLVGAEALLERTPSLLESAHAVVPGVTQAVGRLRPAVAFLRPYTPEAAGWLANWTSLWASNTSTGRNYARALITASGSSVDDNPGILPPGMQQDPAPAPGSIAGQAWTDAHGDDIR